jgi:hypothetical protein
VSSKKLSDQEIRDIYEMVKGYHQQYLEESGVKLPQLERQGKFTKDALVLVYLARNYPNTE